MGATYSQFYDLDSFKAVGDSAKSSGFADAYNGVVQGRTLEAVDPRIFEKKFPALTFLNSGIEADNSGGDVNKIKSLRKLGHGEFRNASDRSNKGKISVSAEDSTITIIGREAESEWSDLEVRQAALENRNLVSDLIAAHNDRYSRDIDTFGYLGNPDDATSQGLLTYSGWVSSAAAGAIATLTAQQKYDVYSDLITDQRNAVNNTPEYMATRVDTPIYCLNDLAATMLNTAAGSSTVLRALQDNFPGVTFSGTPRADNAGGAGVSHTVAYNPNREAMVMRIPQPLMIGEIVKVSSFRYHVETAYRIGTSLDILEDTAARIVTGL